MGDRICLWATCTSTDTRPYVNGWFCSDHTPAKVNGREDVEPDQERTLDGLREKAGIKYGYRRTDSSLNDERAIASGRRRANANDYQAAKAAEETRKKAKRSYTAEYRERTEGKRRK